MRTSDQIDREAQARHFQNALLRRLATGREWATPGIEEALRGALNRIDTGVEAASPRLQASLRAIADELAGGVKAATPRLHERIAKLTPEINTPEQEIPSGKTTRKLWWFIAGGAVGIAGGLALWRGARPVSEPDEVAPAGKPPESSHPGQNPSPNYLAQRPLSIVALASGAVLAGQT